MVHIKQYQGMKIVKKLDDPWQRKIFKLWAKNVKDFYKETVDWQIVNKYTLLNEETCSYFYDKKPEKPVYKKGARPELEKIIVGIKMKAKTKEKLFLSILNFIKNLPVTAPKDFQGVDLFHGGTEEEVIKKHSAMCNEQVRVLVLLCHIAGLPARAVGHILGTHQTAEVYVNSRWVYCDIRGQYFKKSNKDYATVWEFINTPGIIHSQSKSIINNVIPGENYYRSELYVHPKEITVIAEYGFEDVKDYSYDWCIATKAHEKTFKRNRSEINKIQKTKLNFK